MFNIEKDRATAIKETLAFVLNNNYLTYGGITYKQIRGTAMGTSCAPASANLFLAYYEFKVRTNKDWHALFYQRYLDDVFQ